MLSLSIASPSNVTFSLTKNLSSSIPKSQFHGIRIAQVCPNRIPCSASIRNPKSASSVVMMAKREEELKEIRTKTTEQINDEIIDLKGELFMLRLQRSARNEFKSSEFRRMRKRVARMLTVRREREIEEGISKRISRKLDKQYRKSVVYRPPPSLIKLREEEAAEEKAKESSSSS